jgi:hypothetical protein
MARSFPGEVVCCWKQNPLILHVLLSYDKETVKNHAKMKNIKKSVCLLMLTKNGKMENVGFS